MHLSDVLWPELFASCVVVDLKPVRVLSTSNSRSYAIFHSMSVLLCVFDVEINIYSKLRNNVDCRLT